LSNHQPPARVSHHAYVRCLERYGFRLTAPLASEIFSVIDTKAALELPRLHGKQHTFSVYVPSLRQLVIVVVNLSERLIITVGDMSHHSFRLRSELLADPELPRKHRQTKNKAVKKQHRFKDSV